MYTPGETISWEVREWYGDDTGWMTSYFTDEDAARDSFFHRTRFSKLVQVTTERHEQVVMQTGEPMKDEDDQ